MKPKRTILCVDEDERSLSIRKVMLETRGYRVVVCSDAGRAVELMKAGGIDLVLTDLMMLKLGSATLIDQLKAVSPSTPAIVFSGASSNSRTKSSPMSFSPKPTVTLLSCSTISASHWCANAGLSRLSQAQWLPDASHRRREALQIVARQSPEDRMNHHGSAIDQTKYAWSEVRWLCKQKESHSVRARVADLKYRRCDG